MRPSSRNGSASVERVFGSEETALEYRAAKMKEAISNIKLLLLVTHCHGVPPKRFHHKSKKSSEVLLNVIHINQLSPSPGFGIARASLIVFVIRPIKKNRAAITITIALDEITVHCEN